VGVGELCIEHLLVQREGDVKAGSVNGLHQELRGRRASKLASHEAILTARAKVGRHERLPGVPVVLLEHGRVGTGEGGGVIGDRDGGGHVDRCGRRRRQRKNMVRGRLGRRRRGKSNDIRQGAIPRSVRP
jgi:hypothetical protein